MMRHEKQELDVGRDQFDQIRWTKSELDSHQAGTWWDDQAMVWMGMAREEVSTGGILEWSGLVSHWSTRVE